MCLGGGDHTIAAGRVAQTEACSYGAVAIWIIVTHFLLQVHRLSNIVVLKLSQCYISKILATLLSGVVL